MSESRAVIGAGRGRRAARCRPSRIVVIVPALLLGPLAVDPAHEGKGIGGMLMRAAIEEAKNRGHGAILLVGDAAYYERFGFFASRTQHLVMPGPFERNRFLALELKDNWLEGAAGMIVASGRKLAMPPVRRAA